MEKVGRRVSTKHSKLTPPIRRLRRGGGSPPPPPAIRRGGAGGASAAQKTISRPQRAGAGGHTCRVGPRGGLPSPRRRRSRPARRCRRPASLASPRSGGTLARVQNSGSLLCFSKKGLHPLMHRLPTGRSYPCACTSCQSAAAAPTLALPADRLGVLTFMHNLPTGGGSTRSCISSPSAAFASSHAPTAD